MGRLRAPPPRANSVSSSLLTKTEPWDPMHRPQRTRARLGARPACGPAGLALCRSRALVAGSGRLGYAARGSGPGQANAPFDFNRLQRIRSYGSLHDGILRTSLGLVAGGTNEMVRVEAQNGSRRDLTQQDPETRWWRPPPSLAQEPEHPATLIAGWSFGGSSLLAKPPRAKIARQELSLSAFAIASRWAPLLQSGASEPQALATAATVLSLQIVTRPAT